ncbi:response regulator transcription factor [Enterococcus sp. 669A]|uniref:Response regulator transcription factor n=1 Tax=Candidatus Enterococcus moelleringii TaxID=2815325 RepID=A0ABS3LDI4_9ENTE|nr:response regulator transcription factor [Enterococcus sp. 669A]MBO1307691.1 response regulator transcription factor [Enterococcus sp. 669A]
MPANSEKILLVDDEQDILTLLEDVLRQEGYQNILKAATGELAVALCREEKPDAIVLDIMLPGIDGIEVCKQIREFSYCPIVFLSSKNDDIDKLLGLSIGGDDYVTKPFSPKEVAYRIKAQLRRKSYEQANNQKAAIEIGTIRIDTDSQRVYKVDKEISLTAREYQLLEYMAQNAGKIISKERLYEQVWGEYASGVDNTMMVHIHHLREKLENDPSQPKLIVTVKGLGYKLEQV